MNIALLFDCRLPEYGGIYKWPINNKVFSTGIIQASERHMKIWIGDVPIFSYARSLGTWSGPLSRGVKPAKAVPGSASTLRITATASSGSKVSACSTQMIGAVASCTPRLIAAARPRVSCRTTSSPAAPAMATEASVLPPSTASTSAGRGYCARSPHSSRGSPAASFSMGMTMATPVIALG